jgi:diaminopimelate decarboxylase
MDEAAFSVRDGRLYIEDLECTEIAARFGTPLYVMSETRLRSNVRRLGAALSAGWPLGEARLLPSIKANPTLATRAVLTSEGAGCDTFGETELEAALRAGVPPALISVNGASKSTALIQRAVAVGARITLDSGRELPIAEKAAADAGTTARVRIRLRPRLDGVDAPSDFAGDGTSIREVFQSYKAGVPIDDAVALGRAALDSRHIEFIGVHAHLARQTADVSLWRAQIESFADLLAEMSASWGGWLPAEIDVGGGWPSPLDPVGRRAAQARTRPLPADAADYAHAVADGLADALRARGLARDGMLLEAEPGRAIYADAGLHLATVVNVKKQRDPDQRCWIETNTSEVFMLDTTLENSLFPVVSATRADAKPTVLADVTGISCNFDVIAPAVAVPEVAPGEVIAFLETGAYQEASAANFNGLPRPATVLVCGTTAEVVKRRETIDDVLRRDIVPERLHAAAGAAGAA